MRRVILLSACACLVFSTAVVAYGQQGESSKNPVQVAPPSTTATKAVPFACRVDPKAPERVLVDVLGTLWLNLGADDTAGYAVTCLLARVVARC
jgi:hypothetical protein